MSQTKQCAAFTSEDKSGLQYIVKLYINMPFFVYNNIIYNIYNIVYFYTQIEFGFGKCS